MSSDCLWLHAPVATGTRLAIQKNILLSFFL
jgi:hypothetical protein